MSEYPNNKEILLQFYCENITQPKKINSFIGKKSFPIDLTANNLFDKEYRLITTKVIHIDQNAHQSMKKNPNPVQCPKGVK